MNNKNSTGKNNDISLAYLEKSFFSRIIFSLMGVNFSNNKYYYLEKTHKNLEIKNIKDLIKNRFMDSIFACLGLTFLISIILQNSNYQLPREELITYLLIIAFISPILLSWLIPLIWCADDTQIKALTKNGILELNEIGNGIRNGLIGKILGYGGSLAGIIYLFNLSFYFTSFRYNLELYKWIFSIFGILLIAIIPILILINLFYLMFFHGKLVNNIRESLSNYLIIGETSLSDIVTIDEKPKVTTNIEITSQTITPELITPPKENQNIEHEYSPNYCKQCGNKVEGSPTYCRFCGSQLR